MGVLKNIKILLGKEEKTEPKKEPEPQRPRQKILIVEDEKPLADALAWKLKREGFDSTTAPNGKIGLELLESFEPDLILLDLLMPVMDGNTMLAKLRSIPKYKYLPVIVLTNAGDVDNMHEANMHFDATFLIKSNVTLKEIVQTVKNEI